VNLRTDLRKAPLSSGVFAVCGPQGVGKTSFVAALLRTDYRKWRKWRTEQGQILASMYYQATGIRLQVSDHLYFSSTEICLDRRRGIYTHDVDIQRLGLPNDDYGVQYLPRGSVVFVQEADILLFCRDYASLSRYLINLLKFVRHNLITLIFDCQAFDALDAAVRRLIVGIYYITESYTKRFFLFWKPRTWRFIYIQNQLNSVVKELAQVGVKINISVVEGGRFRLFGGNVFDCYDSFSGVRYFLKGIENVGYEYRRASRDDFTIAGIDEFVAQHPLVRPDEMVNRRR